MKSGKKLLAILASILIIVGLAVPAFAAEPGITINGAADGETYTAYLVLHATYPGELREDTPIAYYYEGAAEDPLYVILTEAGLQFDDFVDGKAYLKVEDNDGNPITYTDTQIKTLASKINEAMKATPPLELEEAGHVEASGTTATIAVEKKGLYFVDTTLGSICSIDTAGNATIYEKNSAPTLTKEVQEDTNGNWYTGTAAEGLTVGVATAAFDDEVKFRLTVNTGTNQYAEGTGVDSDYVIVDTIPAEMIPVGEVAAKVGDSPFDGASWSWDIGTHKLTITLNAEKVAALGQNKNIVITYQAKFTSDAVANTVYTNTAVLTYKEQTSTSTAQVKSYAFEIDKINKKQEPLNGVKFTISRAADGKYLNSDGEWVTVEAGGTAPELTTADGGKILVSGIDDDTYTVTETSTLDGYNKLDGPITVVVALDGTVSITEGAGTAADGVITIVNLSGTVLPSTGGIGTTIIYVAGGILVAGAIVLLIIRRRRTQK